ncbi:MAG: hypothetical protein QG594_2435 [Bacteroidota bacterium]|jgi:hypothetical protein|nr:hypothetical protein [Bacteroidota bacterium]
MDTLDEQIKEWTESEISKSCLALAEKGKKGEHIGTLLWMDCSSFSRSDKERIPNVFQAVKETAPGATATAKIRITIVFNHIHNPGKWLVNCPELGINEKVLNSMFAHEAAAEAEEFCREKAMLIVGLFMPQSVINGIEAIKSVILSKKQQWIGKQTAAE